MRATNNDLCRCPVCRVALIWTSHTFARHLLRRHPREFWSIMGDLPEYPDLCRQARFYGALVVFFAAIGVTLIVRGLHRL